MIAARVVSGSSHRFSCVACVRTAARRPLSSSSTSSPLASRHHKHRCHLVFGANTDVGKTIVTAGLVRTSRFPRTSSSGVDDDVLIQYIKPLQSGGSDQRFVENVLQLDHHDKLHPHQAKTLVEWETPASPHTSSRAEGLPVSDEHLLNLLQQQLNQTASAAASSITWCETAGGVLSPGPSSPDNDKPWHARQAKAPMSSPGAWGWRPQADLYQSLASTSTTVLVGDARLGGISATLSSLESLLWRGYRVPAIVVINPDGETDVHANAGALREYVSSGRYQDHPPIQVVELRSIPPDPSVPLDDWYRSDNVMDKFSQLEQHLQQDWNGNNMEPQSSVSSTDTSLSLHLARLYSQRKSAAFNKDATANAWMEKVLGDNDWAYNAKVQPDRVTAVAWAKRNALMTYQRRMRVTDEQKQSMEWSICRHDASHVYESGDSVAGEDDETEDTDFSWVSAKDLVLDAPILAFQDGKLRIRFPEGLEASPDTVTQFESVDKALDVVARRIAPKLYSQYKELIEVQWLVYEHSGVNRKIGAIVLEPVLSRDHVWVDPLWQRALIEIGEARNIPIIYDETGSDVGMTKGHQILHVNPDVAIRRNFSSASKVDPVTTLYTEEVQDVIPKESTDEEREEAGSNEDVMDYLIPAHERHLQSISTAPINFKEEQIRQLSELEQVDECFALGNVVSVSTVHPSDGLVRGILARAQIDSLTTRVDENRIVFSVGPFVGREERRTLLEVIRQELTKTHS